MKGIGNFLIRIVYLLYRQIELSSTTLTKCSNVMKLQSNEVGPAGVGQAKKNTKAKAAQWGIDKRDERRTIKLERQHNSGLFPVLGSRRKPHIKNKKINLSKLITATSMTTSTPCP